MVAHETATRRGGGYWYTVVVGLLLAVLGLLLGAGGVWLAMLGGSWYYVFAGIGLIVSGHSSDPAVAWPVSLPIWSPGSAP